MRVTTENLKAIRIAFLFFILGVILLLNIMVPSGGSNTINAAVTAAEKSPIQKSIILSLSALIVILCIIALIVIVILRNEKIVKRLRN